MAISLVLFILLVFQNNLSATLANQNNPQRIERERTTINNNEGRQNEKVISISEYTDSPDKQYIGLNDSRNIGAVHRVIATPNAYYWILRKHADGNSFTLESKTMPGIFLRKSSRDLRIFNRMLEAGSKNEDSIFRIQKNATMPIYKIQSDNQCFSVHRQNSKLGFHLDRCQDNNKDQLMLFQEEEKNDKERKVPPLDSFDKNQNVPLKIEEINNNPGIPSNDSSLHQNPDNSLPNQDLPILRDNIQSEPEMILHNPETKIANQIPEKMNQNFNVPIVNESAMPMNFEDMLDDLQVPTVTVTVSEKTGDQSIKKTSTSNLPTSSGTVKEDVSTTHEKRVYTTSSLKPVEKTTDILKEIHYCTTTSTVEVKKTQTVTTTSVVNSTQFVTSTITTKKTESPIRVTSSSVSCTTIPVVQTRDANSIDPAENVNDKWNNKLCENKTRESISIEDLSGDSNSSDMDDDSSQEGNCKTSLFTTAIDKISKLVKHKNKTKNKKKSVCEDESDDSISDLAERIKNLTCNEKMYELEGIKIPDVFDFPRIKKKIKPSDNKCCKTMNVVNTFTKPIQLPSIDGNNIDDCLNDVNPQNIQCC